MQLIIYRLLIYKLELNNYFTNGMRIYMFDRYYYTQRVENGVQCQILVEDLAAYQYKIVAITEGYTSELIEKVKLLIIGRGIRNLLNIYKKYESLN